MISTVSACVFVGLGILLSLLLFRALMIVLHAAKQAATIVVIAGSNAVAGAVIRVGALVGLGLFLTARWAFGPAGRVFDRLAGRVAARVDGGAVGEEAPGRSDGAAILGLTRPYTTADVKRRYRDLMVFAHPDKGGSDALAQILNEARADAIRNAK